MCLYPNKFGTKGYENHQSPVKSVFILPCEMQHTYTCYDQRRFCNVSLNVIVIVLNILMDYMKNMEYTDDRKFIEVYVCQKLS